MLKPKIEQALNDQINSELFSSYLYLSMSACFESRSLRGMAHWMRIQAQEELGHVIKLFHFVHDRGGRVLLRQVDAPKTEWATPLEAFQEAYDHECTVSGQIGDLANMAVGENDHAASTFLQWFVSEQVEEEATAKTIVDRLTLAGENGVALFMIDAELGQRSTAGAAAEA